MRGARARACAVRHDASTSAGRRPSSACRLPLAPRSSVTFLVLVHRHAPHPHGRGGGLEPAATSSEHCAAGCCQSRRSVRPARGVQKSNRHHRRTRRECPPGAAKDVHLTVERGRRRDSCGASRRFWRRAAARRHAHLHSLGSAAPSERLSDQIALVGGARRSCARRHRLIAARRRARHSIASRPILLASFVHAFSLALAGRSAQSNGCSHGGPRVSQTRLARSVPAARRSGAESTMLRIGDADWRIGGLENAISNSPTPKSVFSCTPCL